MGALVVLLFLGSLTICDASFVAVMSDEAEMVM